MACRFCTSVEHAACFMTLYSTWEQLNKWRYYRNNPINFINGSHRALCVHVNSIFTNVTHNCMHACIRTCILLPDTKGSLLIPSPYLRIEKSVWRDHALSVCDECSTGTGQTNMQIATITLLPFFTLLVWFPVSLYTHDGRSFLLFRPIDFFYHREKLRIAEWITACIVQLGLGRSPSIGHRCY